MYPMKVTNLFVLIGIVLTVSQVSKAQYASFYERAHCRGGQFGAELSYWCQNIPEGIANKQLSVDTNGACITLYNGRDCEGSEVANFNDARCRNVYAISSNIRSFRQCSGRTNSAVITG